MNAALPTVLVVDDEVRSQEALRRTLDEEFEVYAASSAEEALGLMEREMIRIILCDQRMPGMTGVEFLRQVREQWPDTVRMIISGYTDSEDIVAGINEAGIYRFILKPWRPDALLATVREAAGVFDLNLQNRQLALEMRTAEPVLRREVAARREASRQRGHMDRLVRAPESPLSTVCDMARQVAPFHIPILITGESGTGKELMARAIHYASPRAERPFVVENCGAVPDQLLESELFGHKRGAFTGAYTDHVGLFQQADGGSIFLDEIGETSPAFQVKLLRAIQEGEIRPVGATRPIRVDVRVISATNRDPETEVREGRLRDDLYYRLSAITLHLPALRDRPMDIPLIAQELLAQALKALEKPVRGYTAEAMDCMQTYRWPGNVREMQNEVLRMLALAKGQWLGAELLSPRVLRAAGEEEEEAMATVLRLDGSLKERLEALESRLLKETLIRHRWNKSKAAHELGLSRVGLRSKLSRFGLEEKR